MRRLLVGVGTPLGYSLASCKSFSECLSYKEALKGVPRCREAVLVAPSATSLAGRGFGREGKALIDAVVRAARRLFLLSSIEVYATRGLPLDETHPANGSPERAWLPVFERHVIKSHSHATVLRLPDVFGRNMMRGAAGSFLDHDASQINSVAIHQWYPVRRLDSDIAAARGIDAPVINLCPEPLPMTAVLSELFPGQMGHVKTPAPYSRIRTRFAEAFGGASGYIMSAAEALQEIGDFVRPLRRPPPEVRAKCFWTPPPHRPAAAA
jgi:hypothetical protein